jgi:mRNA interferase MazF
VLVIASNAYLTQADTLAIVLPVTTTDRSWPNHIRLTGDVALSQPSFAMTEQPRTITRERLHTHIGHVNAATMVAIDTWLRDFLALP